MSYVDEALELGILPLLVFIAVTLGTLGATKRVFIALAIGVAAAAIAYLVTNGGS